MRVALIEARDPQRPAQIYMPMGLAYLKSWLERDNRHQVILARSAAEAVAFSPDAVGISAVSPNFPYAQELAQGLRKQSDIPIILGGPHISSCPHSLPDTFIAGVLGEGEITCAELLECLEANPHPTPDTLASIPGLAYRGGQATAAVRLTTPRPLIDAIDELPAPQRSWADPNTPMWSFSSRGCPFRCTFCSTAAFWNKYRLHSPAYVARELKELLTKHQPKLHIFMDDLFAANLERLRELKALFSSSLPYAVPLAVTVRADLVTEQICQVLKELNVQFCHLGLESGSDRVLSYLKAQTTTVEVNQRALDLLHRHRLSAVGSFIIGAPCEDEADIAATWEFIDKNLLAGKLQSFSFGPLVAFPGTKVWDYGCEHGLIDPDRIDWRSLDIDLRAFDLNKYTLFSPLGRARFGHWFEQFHQRWSRQFTR
ncbi:B12-binding domain-containing radical SAM protein [bacterium]|nr:B12-binding domain-containing radical SAM protein [bacterium]